MNFVTYQNVQQIAKEVHSCLGQFITADSTEQSIAQHATKLLAERGAHDTWYHGVPAFVLLGSRSCLSISGGEYQPSLEAVGDTNLITVDLSPMIDGVWGDCARSYFVENGVHVVRPSSDVFREGMKMEMELHKRMKSYVAPDTLFSELYEFGNKEIESLGYKNLDFLGNLGHSIELIPSDRKFIDKNCHEPLGSVRFFTFEPHICKLGCSWGFKHENIYYFNHEGDIAEL